jgi:glycosyltransferase involved in cell wall biosynthesis
VSVLSGLEVLFIAGTLGQGGAERQLYYILRTLVQHSARPTLLSLTRGEHWEAPIAELGVRVEWIGQNRSRFVRLARVLKATREFGPDLVQSQHFYTNLYTAVAARMRGLGAIGAIRNDVHSEKADSGRWLGALQLSLPDLLAANSQAAIQTLARLGISESRVAWLPNVVDTTTFRPFVREQGDEVVILGLGRLVAQKRFDRFLRVLAAARRHAALHLKGIIVGDGPLGMHLQETARALGLSRGDVEFVGPAQDVRPLLQNADLLFLTSDHEGTPNVILEAMACGVPVVATDVGDVPELIQSGETGFVCPRDSENELVSAITQLANQRELRQRLGRAARQRAEIRHSIPTLRTALEALYYRLAQ